MHTVLDYPAVLIEQNGLFVQTALSADPKTSIPTCPDWNMRQLTRHVGRAQRWAAHIINTRGNVSLDPRSVPNGRPPEDAEGAREWLLAGPGVLLDAVAQVGGPDVTVSTFVGPRPARWWIRRLLHESTVHRADAVLAIAERYELAPAVAADGIDEWLERLTEIPWRGALPIGNGEIVTLIPNDVDARWTMLRLGNSLDLSRNATESMVSVKLSGPAIDLFLALMRRSDAEETGCTIKGDPGPWTTFLARTPNAAPGTE